MSTFFYQLAVLYLIAVVGFLAKRKKVIQPTADTIMTQIILYITLPSLIIYALDIPFSHQLLSEFTILFILGFFVLLSIMLFSAWYVKLRSLPEQMVAVQQGVMIFGNQGFMGVALILVLFQEEGLMYATVFNIPLFLLIWTYGIYLFIKDNKHYKLSSVLLNAGVIATVTGTFLFITPLTLPALISDTLREIGQMTVPLSMLLVGSLIANIPLAKIIAHMKAEVTWVAIGTKLFLMPLLLAPFLYLLPHMFLPIIIGMLVCAMPTASTISMYATRYGGDAEYASVIVALSTILAMLSLPLLYFIFYL